MVKMVESFYEHTLNSGITGQLLNYAESITDWHDVKQEYMGKPYQSVKAHRVPRNHVVERHIVETFLTFNQYYYRYDLVGTFEMQFLKYNEHDGYDWHCDYGVSENPHAVRKLSMIIQLSDMWEYNGADVTLRDWHNREHVLNKECGNLVVFDSRVPHKVSPLTLGERYSLVAWAHGPEWR